MSSPWRRRRRIVAVALATVGLLAPMAACSAGAESDGKVTLTVSLFGRFGYADLYKQYEKDHPNVKIVERAEAQLDVYNQQLTRRLAANKGAGDVVAIEEGILTQFLDRPQIFVNFLDQDVDKSKWLDWKWEQSLADNGKYQIGLGTDVGGLAMCYRRDLFQKAGLPVERDQVSALWPDWNAYIATGQKFAAAKTGAKFLDAATNTYNTILRQQGDQTYFDRDDKLVIDSSTEVRTAWDITMRMVQANLSANLKAFTDPWNAGFKSGAFATIACPAWMTGYIKEQAGPSANDKWDIAKVPGNGGNWGGSFLAVPKQSKHQKEAVALAKYLTSPKGQLAAYKAEGVLPSSPQLYDDPAVKDSKNEYFNDAPVGEIFVAGAKDLKPAYLGSKNQPVRDAVENAMRSVEEKKRTPDQAWKDAVDAAKRAAGG